MTISQEAIIDPQRPIVDPHHHLWDRTRLSLHDIPFADHGFNEMLRQRSLYMLDDLLADTNSGHNIRATVFIECHSMYRQHGPKALRCVGETEFVNGVAAMSASGQYGETRACAAIVSHADLRMGEAVEEVLQAHTEAGGGRFRGIRHSAAYDADDSVLGPLSGRVPAGLYLDPEFRAGLAVVQRLGLTFDAWLLEPQLADLIDLARSFPDTTIIMDHVGTPLGLGAYQGKREARFDEWHKNIQALAQCDNVMVKLGGLAMPFGGFKWSCENRPASSQELAEAWRPYIEACIEAFGPRRCMFESNFPVDSFTCDYATVWNAFKRIVEHCSEDDKNALFSGTAARVYDLDLKN